MGRNRDDGSADDAAVAMTVSFGLCNGFVRFEEFDTNLQTIRSVFMSNDAEGTNEQGIKKGEVLCRHHGMKVT